jgi:hypothetical protein
MDPFFPPSDFSCIRPIFLANIWKKIGRKDGKIPICPSKKIGRLQKTDPFFCLFV